MRPLARPARWLGHRRWFAALMARILPSLDRAWYRISGGRTVIASAAAPTLLLEFAGAPAVPLLYARDGEDLIVAATNWGRPEHPRWSERLLHSPAATVAVGRRRWAVSATPLDGDERDAVWPDLEAIWPAFATYRMRTHREIRVFRLVAPTAPGDRGTMDHT